MDPRARIISDALRLARQYGQASRGYALGGAPDDAQSLVSAQPTPAPVVPQAVPTPAPAPLEGRQVAPKKLKPVKYKSWDDVPTINPQDLVGKKVFPIFADLTKAGSSYEGIDSTKLAQPEQLYGGPGYPLLPESQQHGLAWAVEGKGRGTSKLLKDADYIVVSAMEPFSHQSNASFANALTKNMLAYAADNRITPENLQKINDMIRAPSAQKELKGLELFPGFDHPDAETFMRGMTFEQRKRVAQVLESKAAQELGAPNLSKVTRATLDPNFAGVPSRHGMFLMKVPRKKSGEVDDAELNELLVHLKNEGLPEHPSYQYGIKGDIVGKFHHPVAPEVMFKDWFDKAHAEAKAKQEAGQKTNVRRAFDLAMPVATISQEVADMLPHHPKDIQSGRAAQLALNAFNDEWHSTEDAVNKGGLGPAQLAQALKDSDYSSTLTQYSQKDIADMAKKGEFTGYKLKDGEVYFGLKRGVNYADEYGFEHPDLTPNETALVSVVNNEPGAKGVGGAPVVLKAIQHGATALDAFAVPSAKHPKGFLPDFYSHFGFNELGRIPFDPKYVSPQQFEDMKHQWTKSGWDEKLGLPDIVIMKWNGNDGDRNDAIRNFVTQSSASAGGGDGGPDVESASRAFKQGAGSPVGAPSGTSGISDASGDRRAVRADRNARSSDRFARTLAAISQSTPDELRHFGVSEESFKAAKKRGLKDGGEVPQEGSNYVTQQDGPFYRVQASGVGEGRPFHSSVEEALGRSPGRGFDEGVGGSSGAPVSGTQTPFSPEALAQVINDPQRNKPLQVANQFVQGKFGRDLKKPDMPASSLRKQSAIGRAFQEAITDNPQYKDAVFDAYRRQYPTLLMKAGAKNYDDLLKASYAQLIKETDEQFKALPLRFSYHRAGEGDYPNSKAMAHDVHHNGHLFVFQGGDPHDFLGKVDPETGLTANEKFRAVHDAFGHAIHGNPFGAQGEEIAWGLHHQMYSPLAQLAMTAETRGQNSYVNYTPLNLDIITRSHELENLAERARREGNEEAEKLAKQEKAELYKSWQYAPQKGVLLPPEFLDMEYEGGMPDYMRKAMMVDPATATSSPLTHFSREPNLSELDPSRYGTGLRGDERERVRMPGGVKDRAYFYMKDAKEAQPEMGLGKHTYETKSDRLYDITADPLRLFALAREKNRTPHTSDVNPGAINNAQAANDMERMIKEHGYEGLANPKSSWPMAVLFDKKPVEYRGERGKFNEGGSSIVKRALMITSKKA